MNKRGGIQLTFRLLIFLLLSSPCTAHAGLPSEKAADTVQLQKEELLCAQIQDKIKNNQDIRKVVKTSIQLGYEACAVIKCSIKGGGNLSQVITGAIDAGTTKDIVSRCALDAGAEAKEVAAILSNVSVPGICYILPEEPEIIVPPPLILISPSTF